MTRDCNDSIESNGRVAVFSGANSSKIVIEHQQQLVSLLKKSTTRSSNKNNLTSLSSTSSLSARGRCFMPSITQDQVKTRSQNSGQDSCPLSCKDSNKNHIMAAATTTTTTTTDDLKVSVSCSLDKTDSMSTPNSTNGPYNTPQEQAPQDNMAGKTKRTTTTTTTTTTGQPKKSQKPRRRVATVAQRRAANIRERRRMFNLNSAFDRLRKKVPSFAYEKRLSRIETLKLAIMYIKFMDDLVNDDAYAEKYKQLTANSSLGAASSSAAASFLTSGHYLSLYRNSCGATSNQHESPTSTMPHQPRSFDNNTLITTPTAADLDAVRGGDIKTNCGKNILAKLEVETNHPLVYSSPTLPANQRNQYEDASSMRRLNVDTCPSGQCFDQYRAKAGHINKSITSPPLLTCCSSPSSVSAITCNSSSSSSSSSSLMTNSDDLSPNSTSSPSQMYSCTSSRHIQNQSSSDHNNNNNNIQHSASRQQLSSLSNVYYSNSSTPTPSHYNNNRTDVRYNPASVQQSMAGATSSPSSCAGQAAIDHNNSTKQVAYYNQNYHQPQQQHHQQPICSSDYMPSSAQCNVISGSQANQNQQSAPFGAAVDSHYKFDYNHHHHHPDHHQANGMLCHQEQQQQHLAGAAPPTSALQPSGQSICANGGGYSLHSLQAR